MSRDRVGQERVIMSGRMNLAPCWDAATASLAPYRAPDTFVLLSRQSAIANEQLGHGYDGGWNMTQRTANGSPTSYAVKDCNQVTAVSGVGSSTFDAKGNLISRIYDPSGPKTYVYDDENRLVEARTDTGYTPDASRWRSTWVYDGLSRPAEVGPR